MLSDGVLRDQLVNLYGFTVHNTRISKDRRTVHLLWDAHPGKAQVGGR